MSLRMSRLIPGAALLLALTLAGAMCGTRAPSFRAEPPAYAGDSKSSGRTVEGTWRVQITRRDCQTGAELAPATPGLLTFAAGGTVTETTTVFPPAMRGPGHGFWRHNGGQRYFAITEALLFNPSAQPTSAWIGTQRITQTIQLNDNELNVTASVEFFGSNGNPIPGFPSGPGCATAVARRME